MKTRNKVLSLAAVLALGLGGFGGTFALWSVEKDVAADSATLSSGYLQFDDTTSISQKWIDLTAVAADDYYTAATGADKVELEGNPVLVPGGVYGKIVTVTPQLKGKNLVAKLYAVGAAATGVTGENNPFSLEVVKIWTTEDDVVAGDSAIEFVESASTVTLPNHETKTRAVSDTPINVLVVAKMDGEATGFMNQSGITLPSVKIKADQVSPAQLIDVN